MAVCRPVGDICSDWRATARPAFPAPVPPVPGHRSFDARAPLPTMLPSRTGVRTLVAAA